MKRHQDASAMNIISGITFHSRQESPLSSSRSRDGGKLATTKVVSRNAGLVNLTEQPSTRMSNYSSKRAPHFNKQALVLGRHDMTLNRHYGTQSQQKMMLGPLRPHVSKVLQPNAYRNLQGAHLKMDLNKNGSLASLPLNLNFT